MAEGSGAAVAEATTVHEGWTLAGEGAEEAAVALKADAAPAEPDAVSKAASELGKRGGKAAAEARAKAPKEAPEPKEPKAEAKPAEPEADDETDEAPEDKRSRARQRVEEATRQAAEAKRERDRAARERDEARAELDRERRARQAPPPEPRRQAEPEQDGPPEPRPEDFDDYNQYQQALIDHRVERKLTAVQKEAKEREYHERRAASIDSKLNKFRESVQSGGEGFLDEISEDVKALRPTHALQQGEAPSGRNFLADALILRSDHAPALMRHLTENPRDLQRIAELGSPYEIALEVGRLTGLFEARGGATAGSSPSSGSPASKPVSKAPPPVRPVTGAPSTASGEHYREGESFDEWYRRTKGR